MIITLIEQYEYDFLLDIQKRFPALTFQNEGYQYIDKSKLSEDDLKALKHVESVLRKSIKGFSKFYNFCNSKDGQLSIRFDYEYSWCMDKETGHMYQQGIRFKGVGYLKLIQLLNGFEKKENG